MHSIVYVCLKGEMEMNDIWYATNLDIPVQHHESNAFSGFLPLGSDSNPLICHTGWYLWPVLHHLLNLCMKTKGILEKDELDNPWYSSWG